MVLEMSEHRQDKRLQRGMQTISLLTNEKNNILFIMEKLIFIYSGGSEMNFFRETIPFEYESREKAENDFFNMAYECFSKNLLDYSRNDTLFFKDKEIYASDFFFTNEEKRKLFKYENMNGWEYCPPTILTLEEWFDNNKEEIYQKVVDSEK